MAGRQNTWLLTGVNLVPDLNLGNNSESEKSSMIQHEDMMKDNHKCASLQAVNTYILDGNTYTFQYEI